MVRKNVASVHHAAAEVPDYFLIVVANDTTTSEVGASRLIQLEELSHQLDKADLGFFNRSHEIPSCPSCRSRDIVFRGQWTAHAFSESGLGRFRAKSKGLRVSDSYSA